MNLLVPIDALCCTVPVLAALLAQITWPEVVNNLVTGLCIVAVVWIILKYWFQ